MKNLAIILAISFILLLSKSLYAVDINNALVAYYPFSNSFNDASANSNHAISDGVVFTNDKSGDANNAVDFSGSDANLKINHNSHLDLSPRDGLSIFMWIKTQPDGHGSLSLIEKKTSVTNSHHKGLISFSVNKDGRLRCHIGIGYGPTQKDDTYSESSINSGKWHHIGVVVYNGKNVDFYIDGQLDNTDSICCKQGPETTQGWRIGLHVNWVGDFKNQFNGKMDDVRLYNRALSEYEIKNLYNDYSANLPEAIVIPDKAWQINEHTPELVEFANNTYKLRWYGISTDNTVYYFPVITYIPDPATPDQEEVVSNKALLETMHLYFDLTYDRPFRWNDYISLNFDISTWSENKDFWNDEAKSWNPNNANKYATGLYTCGLAASTVIAIAGINFNGLLGAVTAGSALLNLTTQTSDFISNLAEFENSEEVIGFAVEAIGNLNDEERQKLQNAIGYWNFITAKAEQINTGGITIAQVLLEPGNISYNNWIEIKDNIRAAKYFGYHSKYGKMALKGSASIAASQAVLSVANAAITSLSKKCAPLMIKLFRNANLHCIVLASLCKKIEEDVAHLTSGAIIDYNEYSLLLIQILKNMQLYKEVLHEFSSGTHTFLVNLNNAGSLGYCDIAVDDNDIIFWNDFTSTLKTSVEDIREEVYHLSQEWDFVLKNVYQCNSPKKTMPWLMLLLRD